MSMTFEEALEYIYKVVKCREQDKTKCNGCESCSYNFKFGWTYKAEKAIAQYYEEKHRQSEQTPAQPEPSEITDEQAILHLQSTGWMQNHDREMYESGLREQLADDSGGYDSLIPCEDTIRRQAAIDALDVLCQEHRYKIPGKRETYSQYNEAWQDALDRAEGAIFNLPPAQPEYEPVTAEDFAKTMSVTTAYSFMAWYGTALALMEGQGFVICKKTM